MAAKNAICTWDFTCSEKMYDIGLLKKDLNERCKKWSFQLEEGEGGFRHYQGRVSLKLKSRNMKGVMSPCSWSITSNENKDNEFYIMKESTRIDGPWSDRDVVIVVPRQIEEIEELWPWQQQVLDRALEWNTRNIDYIYCPSGNKGKSTLCGWVRAHRLGRALPPMNDMKDIMRMVCDVPTERLYLFDMPRCMKKDKLFGFYSGIEMLKDGYAYDDRHSFKEKIFDCPNIYIFSNTLPEIDLLSSDRWRVWIIVANHLVAYQMPTASS